MNSRIPRVTQEQNVLEYIFFPDSKVFVFMFFFYEKKNLNIVPFNAYQNFSDKQH